MKSLQTIQPCIEFWFDFASNYSYLSVMRIEAAAGARGAKLIWQPFLLGPIFEDLGWSTSPFVLQKLKGDYVWSDMHRQCRKYGLPWRQPGHFPRRTLLPLRVALLGSDQPWIGAYCRRMMLLNFAEDCEIDSVERVTQVLEELGLPAAQLIAEAQSDANRRNFRSQTDLARGKGIFGAPTFFVKGEMFWGNDRLDDALDASVEIAS